MKTELNRQQESVHGFALTDPFSLFYLSLERIRMNAKIQKSRKIAAHCFTTGHHTSSRIALVGVFKLFVLSIVVIFDVDFTLCHVPWLLLVKENV